MRLKLFSEKLALCKLPADADMNRWLNDDGPLNVTINDPHGKTVICKHSLVAERKSEILDHSVWSCFQIDEIFEVDSIGIVAEFSKLLAAQELSLFVISSYETDYLLVMPDKAEQAKQIFENAGHQVSLVATMDPGQEQ